MELMKQKVLYKIEAHAKGGERVTHEGKNVWFGIDPVGLHSYYKTACDKKWKISGANFMKKMRKLAHQGTMFELKMHVGRQISRQKWRTVTTLEVA